MINNLKIKQFKCIDDEDFTFENLTILTGLNSAGKSSVIQSILLMSHYFGQQKFLSENIISFAINSNMYLNAKEFSITVDDACLTKNIDEINQQGHLPNFTNEQDIFHIDANRLGPEELALYSSENKIGKHGEFIFSYYEQNKNKAIEKSLIKSEVSDTLQSNIDYWLSYILDVEVELNTERVTSSHVKVSYKFNKLATAMSPDSLGAGTSYVVKVLIVCLLAKQGNILLIENPEIHLHPKAQAKLGEFCAFVASHGVQVVVETHCEHVINQIRYEVYKHHIKNDDVVIYYKEDSRKPFEKIEIKETGHLIRENKEARGNFPTGFFNSTLKELLEIG
ncbi:AAA family ATPase [Candidatus Parabeggiatoa sp. HSG14]|uniref:AAA family ATPase n=1 Tax=Candidatus Parabeggiatoa sp. HSG14 TaxID=3055593 RepID=UPI0025A79A7B|nr:AAA family ATPase [Thiotrichales bacterium HSG14]